MGYNMQQKNQDADQKGFSSESASFNGKWNAIFAIIAIAIVEVYALSRGIDGTILAGTIAIIAGLGGYTAGKKK